MPAGAVLLVGAQHRRDARRALERRRALHVPAALPHERAQRVHPGAQPRRGVRRRRALLGLALLGPRARRRRDGDLPARRDGLDPLEDRQRAGREAAPRARGARPGDADRAARAVPRALRRAPARRLRHDRDERRDRRARRAAAPGHDGARDAGLPGQGRRRERRGGARRHRGRARDARRRRVRVRDRLLAHARADGRELAQPLVPLGRPRRARPRRQLPLPRPPQGRDPPPRREHLRVGGRAGAAVAPGRRRGRRRSPCPPSSARTT